jgi:hypothetical protein
MWKRGDAIDKVRGSPHASALRTMGTERLWHVLAVATVDSRDLVQSIMLPSQIASKVRETSILCVEG